MISELLTQLESHVPANVLISFAVSSVFMFVGTLVAIPIILMRLPADYFDIRIPRPWMENHHPVLRVIGHIVKNMVGAIFLFAGLLMLFLPGQGVLTMLIGLSLVEFPGKAASGSQDRGAVDRAQHDQLHACQVQQTATDHRSGYK